MNHARPHIRVARPAAAAALAELAERSFRDTFAADNRPEDMDKHCAESYGLAIQAREIADSALLRCWSRMATR